VTPALSRVSFLLVAEDRADRLVVPGVASRSPQWSPHAELFDFNSPTAGGKYRA